jgi:hypothetical protein
MSWREASVAAAGIGALLLTTALACGADVAGPKAEGFKELLPNKILSTDKKKQRDYEDQINRIVRGASLAENEKIFDGYFVTYVFPLWTQTTEKSLNELPKERDKFIRNYLEMSAKNPAAHARLVDITHKKLTEIVQDSELHPAVRYNAILIIGLLNEIEPNRGTGVKQMPEPYVPALSTLVEELKKPGNNEALRVGALLGVSRHLEWDNFKQAMGKIKPDVRKEIVDELTSIVNTNVPPAGRSAEGQTWLRRRALEALRHANAVTVDPDFAILLDKIIGEDTEPMSVRCTAAEVMSHLNFPAPGPEVSPMAKKLGYLALFACHTELLRLEGLKKKDEELLKVSGGATGGSGMMGMPGAGGMMPGMPGGGAMPGGGPPSGMMQGGGAIPGGGAMPGGMAPMMPGMGGGGRKGAGGAGGMGMYGTKDTTLDPKAYRIDYSKRRLRAELYSVQLALGPKKKDAAVKGLSVYAKAEPDTKTLKDITNQVEEVIKKVEEASPSAEAYEKALRKEMKKLEGLTHALPVAAKVDAAKAEAAKGAAAPEEEIPAGAKPAAAKPAAEEPMEEIPMAAPAPKAPAEPAKAGAPAAAPPAGQAAPAAAGKEPPAAPADVGKTPPAAPAGK